jgi:hypothetical protein
LKEHVSPKVQKRDANCSTIPEFPEKDPLLKPVTGDRVNATIDPDKSFMISPAMGITSYGK